ncbi:hypothetical protein N7493_004160 [Penicillium malachiteum]|uniref:Uncharacterized protein n=1 Tax=Penicillium malachiteum TaxID=1324776 RepID=A0AAD6MYH7_9EURO|nr:hypothetical protein N7493_004160 [Penicillium malachiteum]
MLDFDDDASRREKCFTTVTQLPAFVDPKQIPTKKSPFSAVLNHPFIHTIEVILPADAYSSIQAPLEAKLEKIQCARVFMRASDLLENDFFNTYIKTGNILMVSEGRSGSDTVFSLRDGQYRRIRDFGPCLLKIELGKEIYERTGLVGKPIRSGGRKHGKERFVIELNLRLPSMLHGKKGFDKIVWAFQTVLGQSIAWLFCDLSEQTNDGKPIQKHHPRWIDTAPAADHLSQIMVPPLLGLVSKDMPEVDLQEACGSLSEWIAMAQMRSPRLSAEDELEMARVDFPAMDDKVDLRYVGDFMPDAMHHIAQHPHVEDSLMAELLTAYTNENWDYFSEVSELTTPSACENLPSAIDPSLLVIRPDLDADTEMHDAIFSPDIPSDESSRGSSEPSENLEKPENADSQSSSLKTEESSKSSSVKTDQSPTGPTNAPPISVTASQSSSLEREAPQAVFDTHPIPVSESQPMSRSSYNSEGPYPTPPPSQPEWYQQAFSQSYFPQQYYPQPIYAQSLYPPRAAPPFSPPVMAPAPHPMGYNIPLPFTQFTPHIQSHIHAQIPSDVPMAPFPPQFQYHPQFMPPMAHPMYQPQPQPQQQPYIGPRAVPQPVPHHPVPPQPVPSQSVNPQPTTPKRVFEFINTTVPEGFVANPNNHGRWQVDSNGQRHYLNAPAAKRQCVRND